MQKVLKLYNQFSKFNKDSLPFYEACQFGKQHMRTFNSSSSRTSNPLKSRYLDLLGPSLTLAKEGFRDYIHFFGWLHQIYMALSIKNKIRGFWLFYCFH